MSPPATYKQKNIKKAYCILVQYAFLCVNLKPVAYALAYENLPYALAFGKRTKTPVYKKYGNRKIYL